MYSVIAAASIAALLVERELNSHDEIRAFASGDEGFRQIRQRVEVEMPRLVDALGRQREGVGRRDARDRRVDEREPAHLSGITDGIGITDPCADVVADEIHAVEFQRVEEGIDVGGDGRGVVGSGRA